MILKHIKYRNLGHCQRLITKIIYSQNKTNKNYKKYIRMIFENIFYLNTTTH